MAKIKFNLNFGGEQIRTLDDLRDNLSIEATLFTLPTLAVSSRSLFAFSALLPIRPKSKKVYPSLITLKSAKSSGLTSKQESLTKLPATSPNLRTRKKLTMRARKLMMSLCRKSSTIIWTCTISTTVLTLSLLTTTTFSAKNTRSCSRLSTHRDLLRFMLSSLIMGQGRISLFMMMRLKKNKQRSTILPNHSMSIIRGVKELEVACLGHGQSP